MGIDAVVTAAALRRLRRRRMAREPGPALVPVPCARYPSQNAGARWEASRDRRRDGEAPALRCAPYPEADAVSAMSLAGPGYGIFGSCPGSVSL